MVVFLLACVANPSGSGGDSAPSVLVTSDTDAGSGPEDSATPHDSADTGVVPPPNVLFVLLDDVGVDKIGAYGVHDQPPPTPTIDALAAEGVLFENAWTYPSCTPTRAALLTGRHATRTGLGDVLNPPDDVHWLFEPEITLPEMLRESPHGYSSGLVGKWHLVGWDHPAPADHASRQGFDAVRGTLGNLGQSLNEPEALLGYDYWEKNTDGVLSFSERYVTSEQADDVLALCEELPEPWFLLAAFSAPHEPFHAPPDELTTQEVGKGDGNAALYDAMLEAVDTELGRVLDGLDPERRARTWVVVMGDNGTPGAAVTAPAYADRAKESLNDGGVNVPLIVAGPGVADPGRRSEALVHVVDIFATVAELAEVDASALLRTAGDHAGEAVTLDGRSWLPVVTEAAAGERDYLHVERFEPNGPEPVSRGYTVRNAGWKLIDPESGAVELYRYDTEGYAEGENVASSVDTDPAAAAAYDELRAELERWRAEVTYGP